jgi:molybdate/tungstate transport system permease protein
MIRRRATATVIAALFGSVFLLFIAAPLAGIVSVGGADGAGALLRDSELRRSLWLTGWTATIATLLGALGATPIAYLLARRRVRGGSVLSAILDLPLVVPHPVAGIALLLVLGRGSPAGAVLYDWGLRLTGSPAGIIAAMLFVSAPLYVSAARDTFERVDARYESVARTLGDTPWQAFRRVGLPLSARGLVAAGVVMWARAVSEFGAIVILAYNPRVVSVLAYDRFTTSGLAGALPAAAVLVVLALLVLIGIRSLESRRVGYP